MVSGIFVIIALVVGSVAGNYCGKHPKKCQPVELSQPAGE